MDEAVAEEVKKAENAQALENAADALSSAIDDAAGEVDTAVDIVGNEGKPLAEDDVVALRKQKDLLNDLDDSVEADLLRKAVLENDESALAEYNRRIVGIEEEAEARADMEAADEAQADAEAFAELEARDAAELAEDRERQPQRPVLETETNESTELDKDGIPSVVGISRKQSNKINDIMGWERLSAPQRKSNIKLLQDAKDNDADNLAWMKEAALPD